VTENVDRPALAAALLSVVLWASAFVGIRAVAPDLSPGSLALGRLVIGSVALGMLVALRPWQRPRLRDMVLIGAAGLLWFATYNLALNTAEHSVDAGTAAMLVSTAPILIAVSAGVFLREGFPPRLMMGCLVAFLGAVIIALATSGSVQQFQVTGWGLALCIVAALAAAGGVTLEKPVLARVSPLHVTWLACLTGAAICLPFAPGLAHELGAAPLVSIGWLVYLGLFPTAIAFTSWAFALSRMPAGRLGAMGYLISPVTIGLGALLLGEVPPPLAILGGALCIGGVVLARSTWSPHRRAQGLRL
jgi:drug/metabolite transporter (DMT)-like permease